MFDVVHHNILSHGSHICMTLQRTWKKYFNETKHAVLETASKACKISATLMIHIESKLWWKSCRDAL